VLPVNRRGASITILHRRARLGRLERRCPGARPGRWALAQSNVQSVSAWTHVRNPLPLSPSNSMIGGFKVGTISMSAQSAGWLYPRLIRTGAAGCPFFNWRACPSASIFVSSRQDLAPIWPPWRSDHTIGRSSPGARPGGLHGHMQPGGRVGSFLLVWGARGWQRHPSPRPAALGVALVCCCYQYLFLKARRAWMNNLAFGGTRRTRWACENG